MEDEKKRSIVLIGNPNVGKSVIFTLLSGRYTVVSNFPGTTVEYEESEIKIGNKKYRLIDTPGVNSLLPMSEDEEATRDLVLKEDIYAVIVVGDAKNLKRTLNLVIQVIEMGLPIIIVLNMMDEAAELGIKYDLDKLRKIFNVPIIETIAVRRKGIDKIYQALLNVKRGNYEFQYGEEIEIAIGKISDCLPNMNISKKAISLMLLCGDKTLYKFLRQKLSEDCIKNIETICNEYQRKINADVYTIIQLNRVCIAEEIHSEILRSIDKKSSESLIEKLMMHPIFGYIILLIILILIYLIVGKLGAQIAVEFVEDIIFNKYVNPFFSWLFYKYIGNNIISKFFIGDYGLISMALTYGLAIILPIIVSFFIVIGILEDTGYLPRLSILLNKIFKWMGLNGKAVIPMILGLGCDTMATMATRILDTKKERLLATFLLALGIPCSAQLSIIFAMASRISINAFLIWLFVILFVLIVIGYIASRILPGESSDFILEIPPLRIPKINNIVIKTIARLEWYLKEVIPLFIISTAILFIIDRIGLLKLIENISAPLIVHLLNLPIEATSSFLMGFLRRDYAAAGLFNLFIEGKMDEIGAIVSLVSITLFVPCFANTLMIIKERGIWVGLKIIIIVFVLAFVIGGLLNYILRILI